MANEHDPDRARERSVGDIGNMWRQQPRLEQSIAPADVRKRAEDFEKRVGGWKRVSTVMVALLLVKNVWEVWVDTDVIERAGDLLMLVALVFMSYRFWRHARAEVAPATLGRLNCVEHYRARLVRQRELSGDPWAFILPFVPGLGLIILARAFQGRPPLQVAALIALALTMLASVLWVITRGRRSIEREIAALRGE